MITDSHPFPLMGLPHTPDPSGPPVSGRTPLISARSPNGGASSLHSLRSKVTLALLATGLASAAVVGRDADLVGNPLHFMLVDQKVLAPCTHHDSDRIACGLESPRNGIERGHAEPAPDQNHFADAVDVGRHAEGAAEIEDLFTCPITSKLGRRLADCHDNQTDGTFLGIDIGEGKGNSLPLFMKPDDDELSRLRFLRDEGRGYFIVKNIRLADKPFFQYFRHSGLYYHKKGEFFH